MIHFGPRKHTLYIVRGAPGSGKSTLAKRISAYHKINYWEADMYFIDAETGEYKWDLRQLNEAHEWCQGRVKTDITEHNVSVVVSNTFTRYKEMRYYVELALENYYKVKIIECIGEFNNIHGVPDDKVQLMRDRFVRNDCLGLNDEHVHYETYTGTDPEANNTSVS